MSAETARVGELLHPMKVQVFIGDQLIVETDRPSVWTKTFDLIRETHYLDSKSQSAVAAAEKSRREEKEILERMRSRNDQE